MNLGSINWLGILAFVIAIGGFIVAVTWPFKKWIDELDRTNRDESILDGGKK